MTVVGAGHTPPATRVGGAEGRAGGLPVIAIFGPTSSGKTGIAIELAALLRAGGEHPVAVNCDSIQAYRGMATLSGAATPAEREELEHRLLGCVDPSEEMSAGRFAELARREVDELRAAGKRPIVVGGTGLWLMASLTELDLRPPVDHMMRTRIEQRIAREGSAALHAELPPRVSRRIHPSDKQRIGRAHELIASGQEPFIDSQGLWNAHDRVSTNWIAITASREELEARIRARVESCAHDGQREARQILREPALSRTAAAAIGLREYAAGDLEAVIRRHLRYAKRQKTWMRRLGRATIVDRTALSDRDAARRALAAVDAKGKVPS